MHMNYISMTELRTKSAELVKALKRGDKISLVHRSQIIGEIKPMKKPVKPFDAKEFEKILKDLKPHKLIPKKDREKVYRQHLEKKYGKDLS